MHKKTRIYHPQPSLSATISDYPTHRVPRPHPQLSPQMQLESAQADGRQKNMGRDSCLWTLDQRCRRLKSWPTDVFCLAGQRREVAMNRMSVRRIARSSCIRRHFKTLGVPWHIKIECCALAMLLIQCQDRVRNFATSGVYDRVLIDAYVPSVYHWLIGSC